MNGDRKPAGTDRPGAGNAIAAATLALIVVFDLGGLALFQWLEGLQERSRELADWDFRGMTDRLGIIYLALPFLSLAGVGLAIRSLHQTGRVPGHRRTKALAIGSILICGAYLALLLWAVGTHGLM